MSAAQDTDASLIAAGWERIEVENDDGPPGIWWGDPLADSSGAPLPRGADDRSFCSDDAAWLQDRREAYAAKVTTSLRSQLLAADQLILELRKETGRAGAERERAQHLQSEAGRMAGEVNELRSTVEMMREALGVEHDRYDKALDAIRSTLQRRNAELRQAEQELDKANEEIATLTRRYAAAVLRGEDDHARIAEVERRDGVVRRALLHVSEDRHRRCARPDCGMMQEALAFLSSSPAAESIPVPMPFLVAWCDPDGTTAFGLCRDEVIARETRDRLAVNGTAVYTCRVVDGPPDVLAFAMQDDRPRHPANPDPPCGPTCEGCEPAPVTPSNLPPPGPRDERGITVDGDEVRYLTDDRDDERRNELVIQIGGNGDWYVSTTTEGQGCMGKGVRICTSGGASQHVPGLAVAVAQAFRAIESAAKRGAPTRERDAPPACNCMLMCRVPCNGACGCLACREAWSKREPRRERDAAGVETAKRIAHNHYRAAIGKGYDRDRFSVERRDALAEEIARALDGNAMTTSLLRTARYLVVALSNEAREARGIGPTKRRLNLLGYARELAKAAEVELTSETQAWAEKFCASIRETAAALPRKHPLPDNLAEMATEVDAVAGDGLAAVLSPGDLAFIRRNTADMPEEVRALVLRLLEHGEALVDLIAVTRRSILSSPPAGDGADGVAHEGRAGASLPAVRDQEVSAAVSGRQEGDDLASARGLAGEVTSALSSMRWMLSARSPIHDASHSDIPANCRWCELRRAVTRLDEALSRVALASLDSGRHG